MSNNADWFSSNKARSFPLSPLSTGIDDSGKPFLDLWIADLKLRLDTLPGARPYIQSFVMTQSAASIAIAIEDSLVATAVATADDIESRTPVRVSSFDGVAQGFVVFGEFGDPISYRFSGPAQSELAESTVIKRRRFSNDARLQRGGFSPLQSSLVTLRGRGDIELIEGMRTVNGRQVREIAFQLRSSGQSELLLRYAGKCNQLAEGDNCGDPEIYTRIGQVQPDCCGRVFVEFRGCVELIPLTNSCGIGIICQAQIQDTCPTPADAVVEGGILPGSVDDIESYPLLKQVVSPEEVIPPEGVEPNCNTPDEQGDSNQQF